METTQTTAYFVALENSRGAANSDVVYAANENTAIKIAERRHPGYSAVDVERDPDRDRR